ncbi:acyltransferase family protein [Pedobacter fastidiosus]|uniref:Acyltransferase n=1 Tax=Pedobacter fastidiosus TaxID=2765361 RepID=A0ABR7KUY3_9SPHI|nr:acyltransferase [Pedobacter fastidiosus]MBC6111577.1 acyltransferase [Pedobacter fastidiosus]
MLPSQKNHFRFYELDIMRFLAALAVMFYHFTFGSSRLLGTPTFGVDILFRYGYLGVDVFFMISGYVVLMSAMNKSPKYFVISRVVRLYPAYWVCCIITFAIIYITKITPPDTPPVTFKLLAYNLTMFQEFFGKANMYGAFWTLTYELGFYFIILLISALKLWKNLLLILTLWIFYTLVINYSAPSNAFSFFLIPKYSSYFIAGMLFYLLRIKYAPNWKIYLLLILCFLANLKNNILIVNDMNGYYHDFSVYNKYVAIIFVASFYIFFLLSALNKLNFKWLKYPAKLGVLTYPLYLMHGFGIGLFLIWGHNTNKYLLLFLATLLSIILSFLVYYFVEEKFRGKFKILLTNLFAKLN